MSAKANYFRIGVFVLAGLFVLVAITLALGSGRFLRNRVVMETYFDESVQGLDVGSRVKYRGVTIGEVTRITFTYTKYESEKPSTDRARYVLVEAGLNPGLLGGKLASLTERRELAAALIMQGLRVKLAPQGITGTSYLELDYIDAAANPPLAIDWEPEHIYIPSTTSTVTQFVAAAEQVLTRLQRLDIEGTLANFNALMRTATGQLEGLQLPQLAQQARSTLAKAEKLPLEALAREATALAAEMRESNVKLQALIADPAWTTAAREAGSAAARARALLENPAWNESLSRLERSLGAAERLLARTDAAVARVDRVVAGREGDIAATLDNLRLITDNLRELTDSARRYPAGVLFGEPPRPTGAPN